MEKKKYTVETTEKAIEKSDACKDQLLSSDTDGAEKQRNAAFLADHLEEELERLHRVARLNREQAANRLRERLEQTERLRKSSRRLWIGISVAAASVIAFIGYSVLWTHQSSREPVLPLVEVGEITVPTILHERNQTVVALQPLDLKDADHTYVAAAKGTLKEAQGKDTISYEKVVIPAGYTYKVQLADGSTVQLNAGSELRYPSRFNDTIRLVELTGEAYFQVAKSKVPFVVKAGAAQVKVYGTAFNLFYSETLGLSEAVLVEGKIGMSVKGKEVRILPNQRVYHTAEESLQVEEVDPADYIGWMDNSFKYNGAELSRIVFDIGQWYGVKIDVSPELAKETFSLRFDKSSTVDWVVEALGMIVGKNVKKEGGVYYIK